MKVDSQTSASTQPSMDPPTFGLPVYRFIGTSSARAGISQAKILALSKEITTNDWREGSAEGDDDEDDAHVHPPAMRRENFATQRTERDPNESLSALLYATQQRATPKAGVCR